MKMRKPKAPEGDDFLATSEVCEITGWTPNGALYRRKHNLPPAWWRFSRRGIFYLRSDVLAYLESCKGA
jgi:hypothetical protein